MAASGPFRWEVKCKGAAIFLSLLTLPLCQATDSLTATLTQLGATATLTPNVTGKYFVEITASPGPYSTTIPIQVTTTPYTFTPPPNYTPPPVKLVTARATPRVCVDPPSFVGPDGKAPAVYKNARRGKAIKVTLRNVRETIVSATKGAKSTTLQAVYRAGEIATLSYSSKVVGGTTVPDYAKSVTKTVAPGRMVTKRRVITTPINEAVDGCLDKLIDDSSWVVPKKIDKNQDVLGLSGAVGGVRVDGIALMEGASTSVVPPYPTNKPVPAKPTVIPKTTTCREFYAMVANDVVTPGATVTVQLFNIPATPIALKEKGWSTVYRAEFSATLRSRQMGVATATAATFTTTVFTPTCISATYTMVAQAAKKYLPMTAAPQPTSVYDILVNAKAYSDIPDKPPPRNASRVSYPMPLYMVKNDGIPDDVMIPAYPCWAGPVFTKTTIKISKDHPNHVFYEVSKRRARIANGEVDQTVVTIRLGPNRGTVRFIARDRVDSDFNIDLYNEDFKTIESPLDWRIEWDATGKLEGRWMPPFTISTEYRIGEPGKVTAKTNAIRPNLKFTHDVVVQPYWGPSAQGKAGGYPATTQKPTVNFNVTAKTSGELAKLKLTCNHPGAKLTAFWVTPYAMLHSGKNPPPDAFTGAMQNVKWTIVS